ncbi:VOC family protein [Trinickia sp.]|uniref:VOC family protein n=1 Tax=Trinickia sp. TaxID=2571163 RepID=UPI003F7D4DCF
MSTIQSRNEQVLEPVELPRHRRVLQESGPAAGRISGINHLVLFTRDMNEGVRFYRDLLGLRVVRTIRFTPTPEGLRSAAHHSSGLAVSSADPSSVSANMTVRQVFFEMGNGELFSLYETPAVSKQPPAPIVSVLWPAHGTSQWVRPVEPQKLDHMAFDVPTQADVVWFREHLLSNGIAVSDVSERKGANNTHRFISSIYFSDPSGNPLEISSWNKQDVAWQSYDYSDWFMDDDPVPALLENAPSEPQTLMPRWVHASGK